MLGQVYIRIDCQDFEVRECWLAVMAAGPGELVLRVPLDGSIHREPLFGGHADGDCQVRFLQLAKPGGSRARRSSSSGRAPGRP